MVKFRKMLVDNKGFTLIELLVVIAVLGILAAIAIPRLTGITDKAREQNLISSGQTIRSTVEMVIAETGKFPDISHPSDTVTLTRTDVTPNVSYDVSLGSEYTLGGSGVDGTNNTVDVDSYEVTLTDDTITVYITPSGVSTTN